MEAEQMMKTQNLAVMNTESSSDSQLIQDPSPSIRSPDNQHSHGSIQDEFICGVCHLSSHNFGTFLLHKLGHAILNGPLIPCCLCQTSFKTAKSAECHYKYFHNIRSNINRMSPRRRHDDPLSSKNIQQAVIRSVEERDESMSIPLKRKRKHATKPKQSTPVKEALEYITQESLENTQSPGGNILSTKETDTCSFANVTAFERQNINRDEESWPIIDCQNMNSKCLKALKMGLQSKSLPQSEISPVSENIVSSAVNEHTESSGCSWNGDPAKKCISLSAAALTKIKRLASIVSARNVSKEMTQKILILRKSDIKPGIPGLQVGSITRAIGDQLCSDGIKEKRIESASYSENDLLTSQIGSPRIQDASVCSLADVSKFERDFLFQLGMRESAGKNLRYMREVYRCLYCKSFEKCCLDLLIAHMRDNHRDEVMDRCPSEMVTSATVNPSTGIISSEVVSFQEYRSKLLDRKTKDEERKLRLQKEKGLPRHLIGLPCVYCPKRFSTASKLQAHTDKHLNVKRFLCEECGRSFRSWHLLRNHKKDHLNASYGKIKCAFCSFQSGDRSALNKHYRIHPKRSHLCHICGNMYSSLRKHVKVHSLDRPYPCPYKGCTYRFTSEVACKIHYQAHTAEGQRFGCSKCNKRFSRKHHLLRHLAKVHHELFDVQETLCSQIVDSIQPCSSELMTTESDHQFDRSTTSTEVEEFSMHAVGQDSSYN